MNETRRINKDLLYKDLIQLTIEILFFFFWFYGLIVLFSKIMVYAGGSNWFAMPKGISPVFYFISNILMEGYFEAYAIAFMLKKLLVSREKKLLNALFLIIQYIVMILPTKRFAPDINGSAHSKRFFNRNIPGQVVVQSLNKCLWR